MKIDNNPIDLKISEKNEEAEATRYNFKRQSEMDEKMVEIENAYGEIVDDDIALNIENQESRTMMEAAARNEKYKPSSLIKNNLKKESDGDLEIKAVNAADKIIGTFIKNKKERKLINEQQKLEREQPIRKIANILAGRKIDEVIVSGGERKMTDKEKASYTKEEIEERGGKIPTFKQDLDTKMALEILNRLNTKGDLEDIYNENAKSTIINIRQREMEPAEKTKGVRVFVDTGGSWMNFEVDGETTTVRFDHHGTGAREATSGTKMLYEALKKAELLNDSPELEKLVNFVNEYDNLTYLNEVDENGKKVFNEDYFKEVWPNSMYAIAEKMPFNSFKEGKKEPINSFVELVMSGKIKNPSIPFTKEEIDGEIGDIKIGDKTIRELCILAKEGDKSKGVKNIEGSVNAIKCVEDLKRYAKQEGLNLDKTNLGNIVYNNYYGKIKTKGDKEFQVRLVDGLGFIATKALGDNTFGNTFVSWNQEVGKEKFFINSDSGKLEELALRINEKYPECATEVRETFLFGKINGITEAEFLNFIDPKIIKDSNFKLPKEKVKVIKKGVPGKQELPDKTIDGSDSPEDIDGWTEEEENLLNTLLSTIEAAQKNIEKIDKQIKLLKDKELKKVKQEEKNKPEIKTTQEEENNVETKTYSIDLIKEKINKLLSGVEKIDKVKNLEITETEKGLKINTTVVSTGFDIKVELILENKGNGIVATGHSIDAKWPAKGIAEKALTPQLDKISDTLKSYIEKEEKIKVEKLWIENGELKAK